MKRVVITGMGAITPLGNNVNDYWNNLINGVSGAGPITRFDAGKFKTRFACEVKGFDPLNYVEKAEARKYDLYTQYSIAASDEAIKHANIDFETLNKDRVGVIWGSGNGGIQTYQDQMFEFAKGDGTPRFNPFIIPKMLMNIASGIISIRHGLRGVNYVTATACASSNTAMVDALHQIRWGKADMIVTGGAENPIIIGCVGGFSVMKALSSLNDNPQLASRPFDVNRDGFVIGEGAGALVLESLDHALARGANIIAEVAGGGMASDAYHMTGTHPEGTGAYLGMMAALDDAGLTPEDVDYMNAHATSTPVGDISELKAIERVFGNNAKLNISATKSMTGHLLGAAGAIEGIASVKAITEGIIPPTINSVDIEPEFAGRFDLTLGKAVKREVNCAMSNTFGFGGHIATVVFKKYTA
ncbi:beta-ketoacyl-ACP synthase II [Panacibacter sp. DH6]|uniref:3-oxoacyl-[acyl-carrier-protein] synthase 2 n=1 Tax=Panacibacter microcysteis TaxID=2793269 RepID=A0A931E2Y7_9BACT|nr:beta-ketoacyl-ACP synthase II [Panacibacter microcysteis]MBG9375167.1 beta-ketoacyl-ACP synthase II [Panacibacter microcysteis]